MLRYFLVASLVALVVNAISKEEMRVLKKRNALGTSNEEMINRALDGVDEYCAKNQDEQDYRKKRSSAEEIREILRELLEECNDDEEPRPTPPSIDGPCTSINTVNLTGSWRKDNAGSNLKPANNFYACDRELQKNVIWFRFTGDGGRQLSNKCAPSYSCGGHGGFWTDAAMPSQVGQILSVPIYGSWSGDCKWYRWPTSQALTVQRCSSRPGDFVYRVHGTGSCYWTFCGMDL